MTKWGVSKDNIQDRMNSHFRLLKGKRGDPGRVRTTPLPYHGIDLGIAKGFVRYLIRHGDKSGASRLLEKALDILQRRVPDQDVRDVVFQAVHYKELILFAKAIAKPNPKPPRAHRGEYVVDSTDRHRGPAIRAIVEEAALRKERTMPARLAAALHDLFLGPREPTGPDRAAEALLRPG